MAILRTKTTIETHYTALPNTWARNNKLTLRARGLLLLLCSHQVGWSITIESLIRENPEGRNAIRGAIAELEEHGYLRRKEVRNKGKFSGIDYELASPKGDENSPSFDLPMSEKPTSVKPTSENPTHKKNIYKKPIEKETNSEEQSATSAEGETNVPLHIEVTQWVYDQTQGSINFNAVASVIKHSLNRGRAAKDVANAARSLYKMGKPITNQTIGQFIDGAFAQRTQTNSAERLEQLNKAVPQTQSEAYDWGKV